MKPDALTFAVSFPGKLRRFLKGAAKAVVSGSGPHEMQARRDAVPIPHDFATPEGEHRLFALGDQPRARRGEKSVCLHQPLFTHAQSLGTSHDDVIQNSHVN